MREKRINNILVAGGTGFIGSYVVDKLVRRGFRVFVLGRDFNKNDMIRTLLKEKKIYPLRCDLARPKDILRIRNKIKNIDYLVHLAQQPFISENVLDDIKTVCNEQLIGTFNLLEAISSNLKGICFVSSFMVYKGDSVREISETHTLAPQNLYGASKLALESFLRIYSERMNIPLTILRMSSVYGPGDTRKGAVSSFIKSALDGKDLVVYGSGSSFRDYLYVDDAADAIVAATIKNKEGIFNVGTGKKTTILTLAKEIKSMAKNDNLSIRFETKRPDGNCFVLDILKIKKERGFCPVVDKSEGLKRTFIWHKRRILPR